MYKKRITVSEWQHRGSDTLMYQDDFESIVDAFCHNTKGLGLTNPYMSGVLTDYYDIEDWVDVCALSDYSRLKEKKNNPSWVQHVVELHRECREGNNVYCFYAWEDTPYLYMGIHKIGKCPHSEYKSEVVKKYKVRASVEFEFEFESCEDVSRGDVISHIGSVAVDGVNDNIMEYLGDYIEIDDPYEDIEITQDGVVKVLAFTKNGKGVRK